MLTRVQLRAEGDTAHKVEAELVASMEAIASVLSLEALRGDQVIEGTPGKGFHGRLTFTLSEPEMVFADGIQLTGARRTG